MIVWLKLNKFKIIGTVIIIIFFIANSYVSGRYMYNKAIKASDRVIANIKQDMKDSDSRADAAIVQAQIAEQEARAERAEKEKHKANVVKIEKEKQELKDRIAALPPTQVVVHTVEILQVGLKEIMLQPQGILFSLFAGKKNLTFLEEFTLIKKQYSEITMALSKSEKSGKKLSKANTEMKVAIVEKDSQLLGWERAEVEWFNKFSLSEKRGKSKWWRGVKTGSIVGAGIVILIKLVF